MQEVGVVGAAAQTDGGGESRRTNKLRRGIIITQIGKKDVAAKRVVVENIVVARDTRWLSRSCGAIGPGSSWTNPPGTPSWSLPSRRSGS